MNHIKLRINLFTFRGWCTFAPPFLTPTPLFPGALSHRHLQFKGKFDLCLDRSNWKFGEKDINYLVLSWRINKKISLPPLFVDLDKAGNSNTIERIDLLEEFNEVFGFNRIKSAMCLVKIKK